jgi:hypothetical protein
MSSSTSDASATIAHELEPQPAPSAQRTLTIEERAQELTEEAGYLRNITATVTEDVADVHHRSFHLQLDTRVARLAKLDPAKLLDQLADVGFAWRDIARMIRVSVPALRRWRSGERPTGDNRRAIAQLLALVQIITDQVYEPASWMEMQISSAAPTTALDLYADGHYQVIFDLATGNITPDTALDSVQPDWRERFRSDWEVGVADDGEPYIRPKQVGA